VIINDIPFPDNPEWNVISITTINTLCLDVTGFCVDFNVFLVILLPFDAHFSDEKMRYQETN